MEKLERIGQFNAESTEKANEIKKMLIKQGFITHQNEEYEHVVHVYRQVKTK